MRRFLLLWCGTGSFEKQWQCSGVSRETFVRRGGIAAQETAETIGGGFCAGTPCFPDCTQSGRSLNRQTARQAKKRQNAGSGTPLRQKQRPRPVFLTETLRIFRTFERRPTSPARKCPGRYNSWRLQSGERGVPAKRAKPRRRGSARGVIKVGVYKARKRAFPQSVPTSPARKRRGIYKSWHLQSGQKGVSAKRAPPRRHGGAVPPPFKKGVESRRLSEPVFPWQRQERGNVSRGTAGKGVGQKSFCNLRKTLAKKKGR